MEVPHVGRDRRLRRRVDSREGRERREWRRGPSDYAAEMSGSGSHGWDDWVVVVVGVSRNGAVQQRRGPGAELRQGRRAYALEPRALGFGRVNRRRSGEPVVVGRRTGELLDDVPEIVLVDVVDGRLVLILLLLWGLRSRGGGLGVGERMRRRRRRRRRRKRVEVGLSGYGLGDLVGELVEVLEVVISGSRVFSRRWWWAAFIHNITHRNEISVSGSEREEERVGSVCGGLDSGGLGIMSFWQSASRDSEEGVVLLYISNKIG